MVMEKGKRGGGGKARGSQSGQSNLGFTSYDAVLWLRYRLKKIRAGKINVGFPRARPFFSYFKVK